jgi:hypothetical protein
MSGNHVLEAMPESRQCQHTGLSIPECSCRGCCEALLDGCTSDSEHRLRPWRDGVSTPRRVRGDRALWTAAEYASRMGVSVSQLHRLAQAEEIPR